MIFTSELYQKINQSSKNCKISSTQILGIQSGAPIKDIVIQTNLYN